MRIIGIDPGTRVTGYGIIEVIDNRYEVIDFGCIKPSPKNKLTDRYYTLHNDLCLLIERYKPDTLVVETQYVHKNPQSAIKLGMARGVAIIAGKKYGLAIYEYSPTKAKRAVVGNGGASKQQVQQMVKVLLGLKELPQPEDAADALSLAICHAQAARYQSLIEAEI